MHLLITEYLQEDFHANPYTVNVYFIAGPKAQELLECSREDIMLGRMPRVQLTFLDNERGAVGNYDLAEGEEESVEDTEDEDNFIPQIISREEWEESCRLNKAK